METNQFAEFASAVVRQLPRNLNSVTAQRWIKDQTALAEVLRMVLATTTGFELCLAPGQENGGWMKGFDLEKHLQETKLIDRALHLDDELVKGWLANPATYPEKFKGKAIFLWKSQRTTGSDRGVAYLYWDDDRVVVDWGWLGDDWSGDDPALLASS